MNPVDQINRALDAVQGPRAAEPAPVPVAAPQLTVDQIQAIAAAVKGEMQGDAKPWYTSRLVALGLATIISTHVPFLAPLIKSNFEIFATLVGAGIVALRGVTKAPIAVKRAK